MSRNKTLVEAMGRLSNPIVPGELPDPKVLSGSTEAKKKVNRRLKMPVLESVRGIIDNPGQLSNPYSDFNQAFIRLLNAMRDSEARKQRARSKKKLLRRLSKADVDYMVAKYQAGSTIKDLVVDMGIHRTTIMDHLEKRGIPRRGHKRKLNDEIALEAKNLRDLGFSYYELARKYNVSADTIKREILNLTTNT
jgi:hypothetical protein